jgi:predicted transcriptional regulator
MNKEEKGFNFGLDFRIDVGQNVRERRQALGFTTEKLARSASLTNTKVVLFEGGNVKEDEWQQVAIVLLDTLERLEKPNPFKLV